MRLPCAGIAAVRKSCNFAHRCEFFGLTTQNYNERLALTKEPAFFLHTNLKFTGQ